MPSDSRNTSPAEPLRALYDEACEIFDAANAAFQRGDAAAHRRLRAQHDRIAARLETMCKEASDG